MMKKLVDLSLNGTSGSPKKSAPAQPDSVAKVAQTGFMKDFRAGAELALKHGEEEADKIRHEIALAERKAEIARRRAAFNNKMGNDGGLSYAPRAVH